MKLVALFSFHLAASAIAAAPTDARGAGREEEEETSQRRLIYGGDDAVDNEFPWFVALETTIPATTLLPAPYDFIPPQPNPFPLHICGGALIHERFVLTAAHCFNELLTQSDLPLRVRIGSTAIYQEGEVRDVTSTPKYIHPGFSTPQGLPIPFYADALLIMLPSPVNGIPLLELNDRNKQPLIDETVTTVGFGFNDFTQTGPNFALKLQKVELAVDDMENFCDPFLAGNFDGTAGLVNRDQHICLGSQQRTLGISPCSGDSGGPILENRGGAWVHSGIISFGFPGCFNQAGSFNVGPFPTFTTATSSVVDWIRETVNNACTSSSDCPRGDQTCDSTTFTCNECTSNSDCQDGMPGQNICNDYNRCVECKNHGNCADNTVSGKLYCNKDIYECVECNTNSHCVDNTVVNEGNTLLKCNKNEANGVCVKCSKNSHCKDNGANLFCDTEPMNGECVTCTKNGHCKDRTDGLTKCDTEAQACVECTQNGHCKDRTDGLTKCDTEAQECVECTQNGHCKEENLTKCDTEAQKCVECTQNGHCGAGSDCNVHTFTCQQGF